MPDAIAPSTKYFMAASAETAESRLNATSVYCDSASTSSPRYKRQHAVRGDHDHDPEQAEQAENEELAFQEAVVLQVLARIEERDAERDVREHLEHAARGVRDVAAVERDDLLRRRRSTA